MWSFGRSGFRRDLLFCKLPIDLIQHGSGQLKWQFRKSIADYIKLRFGECEGISIFHVKFLMLMREGNRSCHCK